MQNIGFFNGEYEYGQDEFSMFLGIFVVVV